MATSVTLPALGESVTEGTVTRWLKQPGDTVAVDEPLLEVSTDKVDTEIPSPVAGTLLEIKADEDETVEVGAELAVIGDEGESAGSDGGSDGKAAQDRADVDPDAGAESGAGSDDAPTGETDDDFKTETETAPPAASTDDAPPAQETAGSSADTSQEARADGSGSGGSGGGTSVTLPALGESVTEGTVTRWLKQVGDEVAVDEPLLEVSTDKVDTEIPSPVAGTLLEIKADEDETVEVGAELAVIGDGSGDGGGSVSAPEAEDARGDLATGDTDAPTAATQEPTPDATPAAQQSSRSASSSGQSSGQGSQVDRQPGQQGGQPSKAPEARTETSEGDQPTTSDPVPSEEPTPGQQRTSDGGSSSGSAGSEGGAPYVTPLVRKMAAEHGVDLASVTGSGVGGRIRKQDVLDAKKAAEKAEKASSATAASGQAGSQQPAEPTAAASGSSGRGSGSQPVTPSPLRGKTEQMTRLRKVIAKRMVESLQVSAQLTTVVEVDVTNIARLRDAVKTDFAAREGVKLSFLPFFAKAAIDALKAHPSLNASIDTEKGEVTYYDHENLSVAVDTEKGLLTPVVKGAGDLSIAGLARKIADVAERTRTNKIGPDELAGGTFTLTNTGSRGALFDTPIINQPQVAILGTGTVVKRPVVIDDPNLGETIAVRRMVYLALTYDHRIVDGADAARFLTDVKQRLEDGQFEV